MSTPADRGRSMRIMALPRDPNPYQGLLYGAMARYGVTVRYLGELTRSRTVNQLLLPAEVIVRRLAGHRLLHVHWIYPFALPGRSRHRIAGLPSQALFRVFLWAARATGTRVIWTAHNVLPHSPVLWDDVRGRRWLVQSADLVIAHSQSTLDELAALDLRPTRSVVIPYGPFPLPPPALDVEEVLGTASTAGQCLLLFVGKLESYKGVEDLIRAFVASPPAQARLVVAGECSDSQLRQTLLALASRAGDRVHLCLRRLSDAELSAAFAHADVLVLPFRRVTTSSSALHGLGAGLPLVIPDLPGLEDLPAEAVFRYEPLTGLAEALTRAATTPRARLAEMGSAGRSFVEARPWDSVAAETVTAMRALEA